MPALLRSRIYCFYCGGRSQYSKSDKVHQFDCARCEATNYLDENGEIADVPATPTNTSRATATYATGRPNSSSPPAALTLYKSSPDTPLFCNLCMKNQHLLTQCLANYLPPESDPQYAKFEAELPDYKKQLERRYPQVCPRCEPGVRERLRKSAYAARSDILGQNLTKPALHMPGTYQALLRAWMLRVAGALWWTTLIVHFAWHVAGAFGLLPRHPPSDHEDEDITICASTILGCAATATRTGFFSEQCQALFARAVLYADIISLTVVWYNWSMKETWRHRFVGRKQYYRLQTVMLVTRFLMLKALRENMFLPDSKDLRGPHATMVGLLVMTTLLSMKVIVRGPPPKPNLRHVDRPLVEKGSFHLPDDKFTSQAEDYSPVTGVQRHSPPRGFPIDNLAPRGRYSLSRVSAILSSPTTTTRHGVQADYDAEDTMDWEPVRPHQPSAPTYNLRPRSRSKEPMHAAATTSGASFTGSSPFYGKLPPAPKSMEARVRNAANNPVPQFRPVPESKQQDFFQKLRLANSSWASKDYVKSMPDPDKREINLAESKWTLRSDMDAATRGTGLEDLFGSSFKLDDAPGAQIDSSIRASKRQSQSTRDAWTALGGLLKWLMLPLAFGFAAIAMGVVRDTGAFGDAIEPYVETLRRLAYGTS